MNLKTAWLKIREGLLEYDGPSFVKGEAHGYAEAAKKAEILEKALNRTIKAIQYGWLKDNWSIEDARNSLEEYRKEI